MRVSDVCLYLCQSIYLTGAHRVRHDRASSMHSIWDFILHEEYNIPKKYSNDLAVIIIHDSFKFSSNVQKALLTNSNAWTKETRPKFVATGWGIVEVKSCAILSF